jgi:hypothetical protein
LPNRWRLEENTYVVVGILGKWGFKSIHGLHRKKMLQCFMLCFLCPTFSGKDKLVENWDFIVK